MNTIDATYITDDTFRLALDKALKAQNFRKKERNEMIERYLLSPIEARDDILDCEETKARAAQKKDDVPSEKAEQIEFVRWFKQTWPDVVIMMIRNDGSRTFAERPEQLLMGLYPGASDLYIPAWHCWIEMKRIKGSAWSDEQKAFCDYVRSIGDSYYLCYGADDAKNKATGVFLYLKK